jgi:L-2-hydroxyglutarate oxidase LhgO
VYVTLDLGGAAKFGPDVSGWVNSVDFAFDANRSDYFDSAIRRYYPALDSSRLMPGYVGIRPKVAGPSDSAGDFVIQGITEASWVALYGMESPGLTASLAIADYVWELVSRH